MRRAAPPALSAAASCAAILTSVALPAASTSRARVSSALESTPSSCLLTSSRLALVIEPERRAVDRLRSDKTARFIVVEAHGRRQPVALAQGFAQQDVEIALGGEADRRLQRLGDAATWRSTSPRSAPRRSPPAAGHCAPGRREWQSPARTPASSGKRCSSRSQKAWMVCTLRPPGVSMAMANSWRARCISSQVGARSSSSLQLACELAIAAPSPSRPGDRTRASTSRPPPPWCRSAPEFAPAAYRPAAGAARAWSARASCRCRRWRSPTPRTRDRRRRPGCGASRPARVSGLLQLKRPIGLYLLRVGQALDRPLGDPRQVRIVVVVVAEARTAHGAIGRRLAVELGDQAQQAIARRVGAGGDVIDIEVEVAARRLAARGRDVAQQRNAPRGDAGEAAGGRNRRLQGKLRRLARSWRGPPASSGWRPTCSR